MKTYILVLITVCLKHNSASSPRLTENCGLATTTPDSGISERILNGTNATLGAWPWMVEILEDGGHRCGGALITPRHVLTSAHCLTNTPKESFTVLLGSYSSQKTEREDWNQTIGTICIYSQYIQGKHEYDIAIITLKRPVECSETIKPVCLPDINENPDCDAPMYVAGWGFTEPVIWNDQSWSKEEGWFDVGENLRTVDSSSEMNTQEATEDTSGNYEYYYESGAAPMSLAKNIIPDMLQQARVQLIPNEECEGMYNESSLHSNIVCAMHDFGSTCMGDSGGPLVYKTKDDRWTLMGLITATEMPCNVTHLPMYFVRIRPFMDNFILPCVHDPNNCTCKPANDTESSTYN